MESANNYYPDNIPEQSKANRGLYVRSTKSFNSFLALKLMFIIKGNQSLKFQANHQMLFRVTNVCN